MNRQQARQQERESRKKEAIYHVKAGVIRDTVAVEIEKSRKAITKAAVDRLVAAFIMVLNSRFGFGKTRIDKLLAELNTQFEMIDEGYVTLEDFQNWCKEKDINYDNVFGGD